MQSIIYNYDSFQKGMYVCHAHVLCMCIARVIRRGSIKSDLLYQSNQFFDQACQVRKSAMDVTYKFSNIDGEFYLPAITKEKIDGLKVAYKGRKDDVTIVTYPKSGTTWMQQILKLMQRNGEDDTNVPTIFPWLEMYGSKKMEEVQSPRFILSHFKYSHFPGTEPADCPGKFIYVARNPKDVAVSYFYHTLAFEVYEYNGEWNDFFTRFYSGEICEGDWFQHVLGWWKHRDAENILFVKYEDMKKDLRGVVEQVADFVGYDLDPFVVDRIVEGSTFRSMKNNPATNLTTNSIFKRRFGCKEFIRKGIIGDWMNMFTVSQSKLFDDKYERLMKGTGLQFNFGDETK